MATAQEILADEEQLTAWCRERVGDDRIERSWVDRLVPRRGFFDIRLGLRSARGGILNRNIQAWPATAADEIAGGWRLDDCAPERDPILALERLETEEARAEVERTVGSPLRSRELRSYVPRRRATYRYDFESARTVYGKVYQGTRSQTVWSRAQALGQGDVSSLLPQPLDWQQERGLVLWQAAPGELLADSFGGAEYLRTLERTGEALASFHESSPCLQRISYGVGERSLKREVTLTRTLLERVAPFAPGATEILEVLPEIRMRQYYRNREALLHGNLHDRQVVSDGHRITFLDLDAAQLGNPAIDLGNFLAHIDDRDACGDGCAPVAAYRETFLAGYCGHTEPPSEHSVIVAHALALCRLCGLHQFHPRRLSRLRAALGEAVAKI